MKNPQWAIEFINKYLKEKPDFTGKIEINIHKGTMGSVTIIHRINKDDLTE